MTAKAPPLAVLNAIRVVGTASWPTLHTVIQRRAEEGWDRLSDQELRERLTGVVLDTDTLTMRIFWKVGTDLAYAGCNRRFAEDAGFPEPVQLLGLNDSDERFPWVLQAAKYRRDDRDVVQTQTPKLKILERQHGPAGTVWLHTSKAPILVDGEAIGVLGVYEVIDARAAYALAKEK